MNAGGSQGLPLECNFQGVFAEDSLLVIITLVQADAFAVSQVY